MRAAHRATPRSVRVAFLGSNLTVSDALATRDFYRQVVGWSVLNIEMENVKEAYIDYNMLGDHGNTDERPSVCHASRFRT